MLEYQDAVGLASLFFFFFGYNVPISDVQKDNDTVKQLRLI